MYSRSLVSRMYSRSLVLVTPPTLEPVTLDEAKEHCRVPLSDTTQDARITQFIVDARATLERDTERALLRQTRRLGLVQFFDFIQLPGTPLASVGSVQYWDVENTLQTLPASAYLVHTDPAPGVISRVTGEQWPQLAMRPYAVEITYDCGAGSVAELPAGVSQPILLLVSQWYEQRSDALPVEQRPIPNGYRSLASRLAIRVRRGG